ncbi:MAG: flagellar basal body rod protein FlgC [Desulfosarcina sp.]|nr:flagellar basal body rod protein FlgC [Desulfobacterales bacterium]
MNIFNALRISSSGLTAQRIRMNLISSNLANVNTTRIPGGGPYQRQDAVFATCSEPGSFKNMVDMEITGSRSGVEVVGIINDLRPSESKYDPGHPDADKKGYVQMPNVNLIEEMVNMISATRSYEANVTAVNASKKMALKALEIGR